MAKRSKSRSVTISIEDVLWGAGGAVASLAANGVINKATQQMDAGTRDMIGKGLPLAKVGGGVYLATRKKVARNWKFFGVGVAGTGAIEVGIKQAPEFFSIGNAGAADVFDFLGNSNTIQIPINPSGSLPEGEEDGFVNESILGAENYAEDELMVL